MDETERRDRLIQWLEVIFSDVQDLLLDDHVFWELQDIVRNNPQFAQASGLFTQWMASTFVQAAAVGVRRQAKSDDDSVSLKRFLLEIRKFPSLVSREHYISLFEGEDACLIEAGHREFDSVAGEGGPYVSGVLVEEQLRELDGVVKDIEHYVDRRIAHYDKRGLARPTPTFADLSSALKTIEKLVILYWQLLKGDAITILPTIQYDWKDIFRFPWM
jgi:hypothetical protein